MVKDFFYFPSNMKISTYKQYLISAGSLIVDGHVKEKQDKDICFSCK